MRDYLSAVRTTLSNNGAAYGYSLLITASFGLLQTQVGSPTVGQIFLFGVGAVVAFTLLEAASTDLFRDRVRQDPPEVQAFGAAIGFASIFCAMGAVVAVGTLLHKGVAWAVGSFAATSVFLLLAGLETALARQAEERMADDQS